MPASRPLCLRASLQQAFQRAVKEAQHFIATGGPRLGQLPPAMMPDDSADGVMYHPTHSLPAEVRRVLWLHDVVAKGVVAAMDRDD